ncbi:hypothetical protein MESS4_390013 [Mesorhizobium sp. STM 4661]|nr:hypothetical protein MESS4_390013 [Mesorhizobium sp. STM 4661]
MMLDPKKAMLCPEKIESTVTPLMRELRLKGI